MALNPKLLEILACPGCRGRIREREDNGRLECLECGRRYPVQNGIPVLILDSCEDPEEGDT